MRLLSIVGNSLGCSASGERLVSAARDGDFQEAKALLQDNPRLVRYSTNGVKNSPLHYSAAQGHREIVTLPLGSGVDINLRNSRGQTALMQGCEYGHWEVVQTLILFKADIHRTDYVTSGTALHLAALNGHTRCVRLLLADYIPSIANAWDVLRSKSEMKQVVNIEFNTSALFEVINKPADGGLTPLHMATLHGHLETVQLLLDLGASVTTVTVEDGSTVDSIGPGSTPLHYAACGGNAHCCQILIARGASVTAQNENGWIPLMVARSWNRDSILEILSTPQDIHGAVTPSPYLCLPLMSIINIARECGTRNSELSTTCEDPCTVCLERKCTVASEGCNHELCTRCALYLCTMNHSTAAVAKGPLGSIPCPLCRAGIFSFTKLESGPKTRPENNKESFSSPLIRSSFRSLSCHRLSTVKLNTGLVCMDSSDTSSPCLISGSGHRSLRNHFNRMSLRRSSSNAEGRKSSRFFSFNHCVPNNTAR